MHLPDSMKTLNWGRNPITRDTRTHLKGPDQTWSLTLSFTNKTCEPNLMQLQWWGFEYFWSLQVLLQWELQWNMIQQSAKPLNNKMQPVQLLYRHEPTKYVVWRKEGLAMAKLFWDKRNISGATRGHNQCWAVLYYYEEPPVPVLKINWNRSGFNSSFTHQL